jgi:large subunit ribosomal protein L18
MKKKGKKVFLQQKKRYLKKITGTFEKPRLSVYRSHNHIYSQLINDVTGETLVCSSTLQQSIFSTVTSTSTQEASFVVGENLAKKALQKQILEVVFDCGNRPYHGRIQKLAEGARSQGLQF